MSDSELNAGRQTAPDYTKATILPEQAQSGWTDYVHNNFRQAEQEFFDALNSDPDNLESVYGLALTQKAMGKGAEAVANFEKVLAMLPVIADPVRATMLKRLVRGHINFLTTGDWNLERELWHRK